MHVSFQLIFSSNSTPKSFMEFVLSIGLLEMFDWCSLRGMSSHTEFHGKNVNLVFLMFNESSKALKPWL